MKPPKRTTEEKRGNPTPDESSSLTAVKIQTLCQRRRALSHWTRKRPYCLLLGKGDSKRGREALRSGQYGCLPYNKHGLMILGNPTVNHNNADNDSDTDDDAVPPAKKHKALGTSPKYQTPPPDLECPVFKRPVFRPPPAWVPKYNAGEAGGSQDNPFIVPDDDIDTSDDYTSKDHDRSGGSLSTPPISVARSAAGGSTFHDETFDVKLGNQGLEYEAAVTLPQYFNRQMVGTDHHRAAAVASPPSGGLPLITRPSETIETVGARGITIPPLVILEAVMHQAAWYEDGLLPYDWSIGVSESGWTNNKIGLTWLKDVFDKYTRDRTIGRYRLLVLDAHGSHITPEFDPLVAPFNKLSVPESMILRGMKRFSFHGKHGLQ